MVAYTQYGGESAVPLIDELVALYAVVYAEPPYEEGPELVEQFRARLPDDLTREGFSIVTARDGDDLAGVSYGWTMAPGGWWSRADHQPPDDIRDSAKLAVMEWGPVMELLVLDLRASK